MKIKSIYEDHARAIKYAEPNLDAEWEEANRYREFKILGKDAWLKQARIGKVENWSSLGYVGNVCTDLSALESDKVERVQAAIKRDEVELPIVGRWPDGTLDLIAGNTRIATLLNIGIDPKVWVVDVPK